MTVSLFLGGQGTYTLEDLARDLDLGFLVLDMQHAVELVAPACAFEGCMKFVCMTYQRTDDIGSSFAPQFACGVDHIRHPGALSDDFPLSPSAASKTARSRLLQATVPTTVGQNQPAPSLTSSCTLAPSPLFASGGQRSGLPQSPTLSSLPRRRWRPPSRA
jgi:hypothetical protein